jgi:hypothetical protein
MCVEEGFEAYFELVEANLIEEALVFQPFDFYGALFCFLLEDVHFLLVELVEVVLHGAGPPVFPFVLALVVLDVPAEGGAEGVLAVVVEADDGVDDEDEVFVGDGGLEDVGQFGVEDVVEHAHVAELVAEDQVGEAGGADF